jgi:hypothetical protein
LTISVCTQSAPRMITSGVSHVAYTYQGIWKSFTCVETHVFSWHDLFNDRLHSKKGYPLLLSTTSKNAIIEHLLQRGFSRPCQYPILTCLFLSSYWSHVHAQKIYISFSDRQSSFLLQNCESQFFRSSIYYISSLFYYSLRHFASIRIAVYAVLRACFSPYDSNSWSTHCMSLSHPRIPRKWPQ